MLGKDDQSLSHCDRSVAGGEALSQVTAMGSDVAHAVAVMVPSSCFVPKVLTVHLLNQLTHGISYPRGDSVSRGRVRRALGRLDVSAKEARGAAPGVQRATSRFLARAPSFHQFADMRAGPWPGPPSSSCP